MSIIQMKSIYATSRNDSMMTLLMGRYPKQHKQPPGMYKTL